MFKAFRSVIPVLLCRSRIPRTRLGRLDCRRQQSGHTSRTVHRRQDDRRSGQGRMMSRPWWGDVDDDEDDVLDLRRRWVLPPAAESLPVPGWSVHDRTSFHRRCVNACHSHLFISAQQNVYLFYLFITTQQKDQRPLTLSIKAHATSINKTQRNRNKEIETKHYT